MKRSARMFALHFLQMVLAMMAGMLLLPAWFYATQDLSAGWLTRAETESLVMATAMALGMSAWMRVRGHRWREIAEMASSMYAAFVPLYPLFWLDVIDAEQLPVLGHLLMLPAMLVAMLARIDLYAAGHHPRRTRPGRPEVHAADRV